MKFTNKQLAFIENATQSISDDPKTRISAEVKKIISDNNFVIDAHCHVFDGQCINLKYLATRLIAGAVFEFKDWVWRLVTGQRYNLEISLLTNSQMAEKIYNDPLIIPDKDLPSALNRMEQELDLMEIETKTTKSIYGFSLQEFIKRYRTIIQILRSASMEDVYSTFEKKYAVNIILNSLDNGNKKIITIALGMDLNSGWEGKIPKKWEKQNAELSTLAKNNPILPFLPIDPRRENLYKVFLEAFNQDNPQFFGIKCYPALGYLPSDERLMPIFKICSEKNIPVITHCGGETVSTFDKVIEANRLGDKVIFKHENRRVRARELNEPKEWEYVLNEYKDLRLCLGHFGGNSAWENDPKTTHRIPTIH